MKRTGFKRKARKLKGPDGAYDRKLMALWKMIVKLNADFRCEKTGHHGKQIGGPYVLNSHHLFGKGKSALAMRWDPLGGVCLQGIPVHQFGDSNSTFAEKASAHDDLNGCRQYFREKRGEDWWNLCQARLAGKKSWARVDYQAEMLWLKAELKKTMDVYEERMGQLLPQVELQIEKLLRTTL